MLDRRLAPMPTRTLFVSRLRSRSVDGVWRALLAGSFTLFKEWRRGCAERLTAARLSGDGRPACGWPIKLCSELWGLSH